jgi:DNA-binding NtrC family response regulator
VGEDGTGKDLLARALHAASGRAGAFVVASASAMTDSLIEAELFGHEKGAFTGAETARGGLIAEADGGTLFIDDLPEMPEPMQAALLRVLAEGVVRPVGGDRPREVRFRLIAATAIAPAELRRQRILRDDLLYRLHGITLTLPPLRDRPEDVALLFDRFLGASCAGKTPRLREDAERFLLLHPWPGNVRELKSEAERLCALGKEEITPEDLSFVVPESHLEEAVTTVLSPLAEAVEQAEREQIARALALSRGNKSEAARLLGITRRSLYRRLARYGW